MTRAMLAVAALSLAACATLDSPAPETAAPVVADGRDAIAVVRRAADALGGAERLRNVETLRFGFAAEARFPHQGPTPAEPGLFDYFETTEVAFAPAALRVTSGFTGGETAFERVADYDGAEAAARDAFSRQLRQSPHAILRAWLDDPTRVTAVAAGEGEDVLAGAFHGDLVRVAVDRATGRVTRVEAAFEDVRDGDALAAITFSDYAESGGWTAPGRIRVVEAGAAIFDAPYSIYEIDGPALEPSVEKPGDPAPSAPSGPEADHRDLAEGVRVLFDSGGRDYHSLAVATGDGVVLIEAPGGIADGRATAERAAALGPVAHVAATHHHGDHVSGIPGAATPDRTFVVAAGHRDFFATQLTAERSLHPGGHEPIAAPRFAAVPQGGRLEIGGRVVALDAGPSGHVDQHLVFWIPDAGVLFQSDMAVFRWDGSVEPARTQACRLRDVIAEQGLDVGIIVGGHGRPGTPADLDRAVALRAEPCPA